MWKSQSTITTLILTASLLGLVPMVLGQTDHGSSGEPTLFTPAAMSWRDGPAGCPGVFGPVPQPVLMSSGATLAVA